MLIVSKIQRQGGSRITIDGSAYFFEPNAKTGLHMCEVDDKQHAARLLSITEGFEAYDPKEAAELLADAAPAPVQGPPAPTPEQKLEQNIEPEGNADASEGGEDDPEATLENNVEPNDDGLDDLDDISLAHAYEDEFDKKPSGNMKRATMITRIRKARAEAVE